MRDPIGEFELLNRQTGGYEPAFLFDTIAQNNIDDFTNFWRPAFDQKIAEVNGDPGEMKAAHMQDANWKWREKAAYTANRLDDQMFVVEADNRTQGLMLVNLTVYRAEIESQKNKELVYIELLASAPWNRPKSTNKPLYKGIGPLMLSTAIQVSIDAGFKGRIGLHSLPQSYNWYKDACGMTDLGKDAKKGMHYFEMTEDQAQAYLQEA